MTSHKSQVTSHFEKAPKHVAVIMDGNGRWAKQRGFPRIKGHEEGVNRVEEITRSADRLGVRYLTLYAFSKENWKRPADEVGFLMSLLAQFLDSKLKVMMENNVIFKAMVKVKPVFDFVFSIHPSNFF